MALRGSAWRQEEMRDYRKLEVWQLGRQFAVACYELTASFPKEEMYGLTSQLRRAAVSIPQILRKEAEEMPRAISCDF
jgi:hypothetical protein